MAKAHSVANPSSDAHAAGGIPATAKGRGRLDQVLDATERLVRASGLEGVTLRAVANEVGISVGNLQYYAPTRADLFAAMFRRVSETFEGEAAAAVTSDNSWERIEQLLEYWASTHFDPEQPAFWYLWAFSAHDAQAAEVMLRTYQPLVDQVARLIRSADPKVSRRAAADAAGVIASMLEGSSIFLGRGEPAGDHARLQRSVVAAALDVARRASSR
jgi:AcrR family transcriptional regulator